MSTTSKSAEEGPGASASDPSGVTRRSLVVSAGAVAIGSGVVLAACGGSSSSSGTGGAGSSTGSQTLPSEGQPVRGGTLRVAALGTGSTETLDPKYPNSYVDVIRAKQLYDTLFQVSGDTLAPKPGLATSAESNATATKWTLHLRDGVTFHDGTPFTADDVVYTMNLWTDPMQGMNLIATPFIDFKRVRKVDKLTVEVPLIKACAQFTTLLTNQVSSILKAGTKAADFAKPIGTGPFKFVSFSPGRESVFAANPDYWVEGKPYVDKLVIDSTFSDETARSNALLAGQVDVVPAYPTAQAKQQENGGQVNILRAAGTNQFFFGMRVDKAPFTDNRVREALKLTVDRQAMIDSVFSGYAQLGNDVPGYKCEFYDDSIKATQDIEKAKSLLKAAGQENLTVTLETSPVATGMVEGATLLAQQAKAAGITIQIKQVSPNTYYTPTGGYMSRTFGMGTGYSFYSWTQTAVMQLFQGGVLNETRWGSQPGGDKSQAMMEEAIATTDTAKATELWHEVQQQVFTEGGLLYPAWPDWVDAVATNVRGLRAGVAYNLNNWQLLDGWLEKS